MLSHGFTADYCSTERLLREQMIGGSAKGLAALHVYTVYICIFMCVYVGCFFLTGQATAAEDIQETNDCAGHVYFLSFFSLGHCIIKTLEKKKNSNCILFCVLFRPNVTIFFNSKERK